MKWVNAGVKGLNTAHNTEVYLGLYQANTMNTFKENT